MEFLKDVEVRKVGGRCKRNNGPAESIPLRRTKPKLDHVQQTAHHTQGWVFVSELNLKQRGTGTRSLNQAKVILK